MKQKRYDYKYNYAGRSSSIVAKVAIGVLVAAMIGVVGFVAWQFYNMPEYATERGINYLAKDYYENYFYDAFVENLGGHALAEAMGQYDETGMEPTKLRQLLLFDGGRHQDMESVFTSKSYYCNPNNSYVRYKPYAPYGKTDYTYEVNLSCKKL